MVSVLVTRTLQHPILLPLRQHEVVAIDLAGRLQLAVDPAVALLDAARVPGQVEMEEVGAVGLKVEALAGGIRGDEDAQGILHGVGIEAALDLFAPRTAGQTVDDLDTFFRPVRVFDGLFEHVPEMALRPLAVLREDEHAARVPTRRGASRGSPPERRQRRALVLANPVDEPAGLGIGQVPALVRNLLHPLDEPLLAGPKRGIGVCPPFGLGSQGDGLDLFLLLGFDLLARPVGPFVVGIRRLQEKDRVARARCRRIWSARGLLRLLPTTLDGLAMHLEAARERLDGRQQPLLQPDDEQTGRGPRLAGRARVPLLTRRAIFVEQTGQLQLGCIFRKAGDLHPLDVPFRKPALDLAEILLQAADHHVVEDTPAAHRDAAREAIRIEQLQQRGEAVRVTVVRRGGQEQPVLETLREIADRAGELRLDAVAPAGGRCGMVRLVENQQAAGRHRPQPLAHWIRVGRVDQQVVGDQEAAVGAPGVDAEAAFTAHPGDMAPVEDYEDQPETVLQLALPLFQHRRWHGGDDRLDLAAQEQLAGDQARLDGLAEAGVVGDEEVDAREAQGLAQRLHLVGVNRDAGAERGLEQVGVRRRGAVPAQGIEEGGEVAGRVEPFGGESGPALFLQNPPVDLVVPEDFHRLPLRVVVGAGKAHPRRVAGCGRVDDLLDEPLPRADVDQLADARRPFGKRRGRRSVHPASAFFRTKSIRLGIPASSTVLPGGIQT